MTKIVDITPVEVTDPRCGETIMCCSRPIVHPPSLWTIFIDHYHGSMDIYQALTSVDGRRFDRKGPLSKTDINRARNVFRAIEKHGRQNGKPCIGINGKQSCINRQIMFLNKHATATNDYWEKRARAAGQEAMRLPRGKTGIRLANLSDQKDVSILMDDAKLSDQISDTYGERVTQLAEPIGLGRFQVKLARERDAMNEEAEAIHKDRMKDAPEGNAVSS